MQRRHDTLKGQSLRCKRVLVPSHGLWAGTQASIVGHMRRRGLLEDAADCAYLEFGAGAGYLTSMLVDCCEARDLVLIDSGSFRLKADR